MSEANYFSMRRLSPYQGTIQVVEMPGFRAMSADGFVWQVQLMTRAARYSSYGIWRSDGTGDLIETERTAPFLRALRALPPLPFAPADDLELWLLDARDQLPLALITSILDHMSPPRVAEVVWRPSLAEDTSFAAPSLEGFDQGRDPRAWPVPHRDILGRRVRDAAGPYPRAQWFRRDGERHGVGLTGCRIDDRLSGRVLHSSAFPELLIREDWDRRRERELVRDYHHWQAANLLTHPALSRPTRDRLERAACRQAEKLYQVRRLLPEIVNADLIKAALVEAVIRQSGHA